MAYRHLVGGIGVQLKKFLEGKQTLAFGFWYAKQEYQPFK
jgi:hypothetical protein